MFSENTTSSNEQLVRYCPLLDWSVEQKLDRKKTLRDIQ